MSARTTINEIEAGDQFRIIRGSRAGRWGITGSLTVGELDADHALVTIAAGKFGFTIELRVAVVRTEDGVTITATGTAFDEVTISGQVDVESDQFLRVSDVDGALADALIELDGEGGALLDAEVPGLGMVHLVIASG